MEFKEQQLQLLVTSAPKTKMYAGQNNEHDCLASRCVSLDGLVSLNQLAAELRREDNLVFIPAFECYPFGLHNAAISPILANPAVTPIS